MQEQFITWGVVALLLVTTLLLTWPLLRRLQERRAMEKRIAALGVEQLRHVLLDDGMGGQSYFERLLLTPRGILILVGNPRDGIIFGGAQMDTWAQVLGKRTIRFANPLYSLEGQLATLRYHLPNISTEGYVLFCGGSSFPKGKPSGVWVLDDLAEAEADGGQRAIQPVLKTAWERLQQLARKLDKSSERYLLPLEQSPDYLRLGLTGLLLVSAIGWLIWRLV